MSDGHEIDDPLLAKAVSDRDARPWRYYKLEPSALKKFCEQLADNLDTAQAEVARLTTALREAEDQTTRLVELEKAYRESERLMLRQLSDALTDGNAGTWDEVLHAATTAREARVQAERTVRSIATMLGWMNVPPQDTLEAHLRALKERLEQAEARAAQAERERDEEIKATQYTYRAGYEQGKAEAEATVAQLRTALEKAQDYIRTAMKPVSVAAACSEGLYERAHRAGLQHALNAINAEFGKVEALAVSPEGHQAQEP